MPPVEQWNPDFCGDMNLVIKRNGDWWHEGTPFTRFGLVKMLSSVLKKEDEHYFLVTPVEKVGITVEDVPFVITDWQIINENIEVSTQTGDVFIVCENHPIELRMFEETQVPYVLVRRNLWARLHQNVFYQWIDAATDMAASITESEQTNTQPMSTSQPTSKQLVWKSGTYSFSLGEF